LISPQMIISCQRMATYVVPWCFSVLRLRNISTRDEEFVGTSSLQSSRGQMAGMSFDTSNGTGPVFFLRAAGLFLPFVLVSFGWLGSSVSDN
jgi:hypothetical protein